MHIYISNKLTRKHIIHYSNNITYIKLHVIQKFHQVVTLYPAMRFSYFILCNRMSITSNPVLKLDLSGVTIGAGNHTQKAHHSSLKRGEQE